MEILIIIALTWYGMGKYALHPTTRQRDKHRHQKYMERMRRRGGTPTLAEAISIRLAQRIATSGADHGVGRFVLEWWSDSWAYATERRRHRHERARRGELRRQKAARAAARLLGRGAKASGRATWKGAKAAGRATRTGAKAAGQRVRGQRVAAEGERQDGQTDTSDDPGDPGPVDDPTPVDDPDTGGHTGMCPCGAPAVAHGLCMDCIDVPNPICGRCGYRHMEGRCQRTDPAGADTEPEPEPVQEQGDPEPVWADAEAEVIRSDGQPSADQSEPVDAEVVDEPAAPPAEPAAKAPGEPVCSYYGDPVQRTDCPNDAVMHVIYKRDPSEFERGLPLEDRMPSDEYVCEQHFAEHFKGPHTQLAWADIESVYRRTPGGAMPLPGEHYPTNADCQLPAAAHPGKEIAMSAPTTHNITSGETVDPGAAKSFADGVKGFADDLLRQIELSIGSLSQHGVSGDPIDYLRQMQEAAQTLSGSASAAAGHFERHINTQDQVLSDPTVAGTVQGGYLGNKS